MNKLFFFPSPIGPIGIAENGKAITYLLLPGEAPPKDHDRTETGLLQEAAGQVQEYFAGTLRGFNLPLAPSGTSFMLRVWDSLRNIPYGETRSYKDIAESIGNARACRAVGQANNRNPIAIIIPCHRVIGASGKLVGYGGGLEVKSYLLKLEERFANSEANL